MHPLHDYVARQVAEKLKSRKLVVWYDARREFVPFIAELKNSGTVLEKSLFSVSLATDDRHSMTESLLAEYDGSMFELRVIVEPHVCGDVPEHVVIYLPGCVRDSNGSVLMELEKAGECYEPSIKRLARNVLRQRYTDGVIDEILTPENVTYDDLARMSSDMLSDEPPSILKVLFHDASGTDGILAAWLMSDARDVDIESKESIPELAKLLRSRLRLELPEDATLAKLRSIALRYVLIGEFRSDLRGAPPATLAAVSAPKTKDDEKTVRDLAKRFRTYFAGLYPAMADRVEEELNLKNAGIPAEALGSIDTFRFEERALLTHCGELIATRTFDEALRLVAEHEQSFWLDRDVGRKAQWEACRRMAELGQLADLVRSALTSMTNRTPDAWVAAYTAPTNGWYRVDQAQRRLEAWVANMDDEAEERPLGVVRRAYEEVCHTMATGFTNALAKANWAVAESIHQTHIYSEVVVDQPKPVAYFLVDAMRFEMGVELAERLPTTAEVGVRHAVGALPSITPIGMAALQPGAAASFSVVEHGGKLGAQIEEVFLPDLASRRKFTAARLPQLLDLALDELLSLPPSKLARKIEGTQVLVVRSQEIDHAGETGFTFQTPQVMDTVIDNLARAIRKLAAAGVEHAVVSADHGHLFFPVDRDESMRIESPGGAQIALHRRCWIGRGGTTPPGCVREPASALGYASDLDFVFPVGAGVFKAGGDLAFHHGGPSLQELVLPVLTVRIKGQASTETAETVTATGLPDVVTNRIFSVTLLLGGQNLSLFVKDLTVRPLLMAAGKQVGTVGMAIEAELNRTTGCVTLQSEKPVTIAFLLSDDSTPSLRVVVQDPTTDAELYRSPIDIPVRLGV